MKGIMLSILLVHHLLLFAQENKDEYEKAVDYVACVCINDTDGIKTKDCANGEIFHESDLSYRATINLFKSFQDLKTKGISKDNIVQFLSDEIFNNNEYPEIKKFAEKRTGRIDEIKYQIQTHLEEKHVFGDTHVDDVWTNSERDVPSHSTSPVQEPKTEQSKGSFFAINFWGILAVFLVVIVFFALNGRISNINPKLKYVEDKLKALLFAHKSNPQNMNLRVEEQLKKMKEKVDRLESVVNTIESKILEDRSHEVIWKVDNEVKPASQEKVPENEVFFMATPIEEKTFDVSSKSDVFAPTRTLYKFTTDKTNIKASFEFLSDEIGIRDAVNYPQRYITPVCEPQNPLNQNAKKIETIENGFAEKQGDRWIVTKKAKIRYE